MIQSARLGQLTPPCYLSCSGAQAVFNDTWGHMMPKKNESYAGVIKFALTDHSHYGCQPIIISYDFGKLEGPYIHDCLFKAVLDWDTEKFVKGQVYTIKCTFRNYVFYFGKPVI